jgi:hypothetical protein
MGRACVRLCSRLIADVAIPATAKWREVGPCRVGLIGGAQPTRAATGDLRARGQRRVSLARG